MTEFQHLKSEVQNWNLYTDEKLMSKLDSFINNMMTQCEIITRNTQQTLYEAQAVSIYLSDTFNALSNLSNKQFVENSMAPIEEQPIVQPKKTQQRQEMTVEKKEENFQQALKNVIDAFSITANDDDETLTKSTTMSMPTMFRGGDHLPFITGSKAFNQDEFLGIIDRNDSIHRDTLGNDSSNSAVIIEQQSNNDYSDQKTAKVSNTMMQAQQVSYLAPIAGTTNRIAINSTTLGSPPPLQQLFQLHEQEAASKPYRTLEKIAQEEGKKEAEAVQPQISIQQQLNEKLGAHMPSQPSGMQEIRPSVRRVSDIFNDPSYQPIQRPRISQMFEEEVEEEEEEEIGNKNMFRSSNTKKKNFQNLLNPVAGSGNSLLNPFNNANPFDPFGLQNSFMTFNPKSVQAQEVAQREETKKQSERDSLINMATIGVYQETNKVEAQDEEKKEEKPQQRNNLAHLLASDSEEETRLNNQKLLSQMYLGNVQPKSEEIVPEPEEKPVERGRVPKLFSDEEDIPRIQAEEPEKPKPKFDYEEDFFPRRSNAKKGKPARQSRPTLFYSDNEDDAESALPNPGPSTKPKEKRLMKLFEDSDEDDKAVKKSQPKRRLFADME